MKCYGLWKPRRKPERRVYPTLPGAQEPRGIPFTPMTAIDPHKCTGITFFLTSTMIGMHAHTMAKPNPLESFNRIPERSRGRLTWSYLPLPPGEVIEAFGVRELKSPGELLVVQRYRYLVSIANHSSHPSRI
ncbi:hypothetical protein QQZ08_004955 [Neonectria magnoliae]|uniref:Uncharacterized protein n=1 Tax=Neonectria magnoliae TaxID=2732573 RepID=A0ABR1I4P3_9HYPO